MANTNVTTAAQLSEKIQLSNENLLFVHFIGDWATEHCKQINDVLTDLIRERFPKSAAIQVDVDKLPESANQYKIDCVPSVLLFAKGQAVDRIEGVNIPLLVSKANEVSMKYYPFNANFDEVKADNASKAGQNPQQQLNERLKQLINQAKLMIFMKGSRDAPRCGFSKQLIALLESCSAEYETFDILTDEEVRQGLKTYSNWPTYPQVYFNGELIGGLDIIKEMYASGEFQDLIKC